MGFCSTEMYRIIIYISINTVYFVIPGMNVYRISLKWVEKEARGRSSMYSMSFFSLLQMCANRTLKYKRQKNHRSPRDPPMIIIRS